MKILGWLGNFRTKILQTNMVLQVAGAEETSLRLKEIDSCKPD